ncbi:MAG TPA: hypothetical protein VK175_15685 [Leadbetterella sp.]|nr:hypothetical protein [Leadbetterella sp.]
MKINSIFDGGFDGDFDDRKVAEFFINLLDAAQERDPVLYKENFKAFIACRTYLVRWLSDHPPAQKGQFDGFVQMVVSVGSYGMTKAILESFGIHH